MTPDEEARFIALWQEGLETAEIARQLGIKTTTAQSRAYGLQQRGLIQPRPRGGTYPSLRAQERGRAGERVSLGPREKTERWNLHLPQDVVAQTKARAQALGVHPSELVSEVLR